jgi:hypothetical protein
MDRNTPTARADRTARLLTVVVALQVLTLAGSWIGNHAAVLPEAQAQLADPGSQRREMIDELKTLNGKMDRLIEILEGGKLQVQVPEDDEKTSDKPDASRR